MEEQANTQESAKQKPIFLLTEEEEKQYQERSEEKTLARKQQYKKWAIFSLMGFVFLGCMYLLFGGNNIQEEPQKGINELVPQAKEVLLPSDKETAYEQELLEQKQSEREASLGALSDYWKEDEPSEVFQNKIPSSASNPVAHSAHTYRDIHRTLGNFYQDNSAYEQQQKLQEEIESLKLQLAEKKEQDPLQAQMALMEKSYEMAAKYMPKNQQETSVLPFSQMNNPSRDNSYPTSKTTNVDQEIQPISPVYSSQPQVVSRLPRQMADSLALEQWMITSQRTFFDAESFKTSPESLKNSIRACTHLEQSLSENTRVQLRLLEPIRVSGVLIPRGELLTASAKVSGDRLLLDVNSIEYQGNVIAISLTVYDLDGQQGLYLLYTPDANAFREIAAGMSQSSGTNFTFNSSAKDQVVSDLSKGVIQGTSSYLSKKIAKPAVKVKAGYQVLLVGKR